MKTALVTGAGGFIGSRLVQVLVEAGWKVRAVYRSRAFEGENIEPVVVEDICAFSGWGEAMKDVDVVVHLAALVHAEGEGSHSHAEYFDVNVTATGEIARVAVQAGVKRFLFMSSVKAVGEEAPGAKPFRDTTKSTPQDAYGESKLKAEKLLREIEKKTGLDVVILRPPLVYGLGVGANMGKLIESINKWPIFPVASVHNSRSFVYVDNLVDAVKVCLEKPEAAGCTFFVSDKKNVSTLELVSLIAGFSKQGAIILKLPESLLLGIGWIFDSFQKLFSLSMPVNSKSISKLFCSLAVDSSVITEKLGWEPPYTLYKGLKITVAYGLNDK